MDPIIIQPDHPGNYYALFYLLAFLAGFVLLMFEGRKRKFPALPWMMVIATAFLFFMIGCRLITFSKAEWSYVLRLEPIPYSTARSILGGILLTVPGIWLARKLLRFNHDMADAFSFVLPLALVVQRFGCLMAGCCYGTPADLPWAVQYGQGSHAFVQQVREGLVPAQAALAMPVHPVQIYEVLCSMAIIVLLFRLRRALKAPGNLFMASIGLYTTFRFVLEFVRASAGHPVGGEYIFQLNYVQWFILLIVPPLFLFIRHRERNVSPSAAFPDNDHEFIRPAVYFVLIITLFVLVSPWLGTLEITSFNIVLLPMLATLSWYLFAWATEPRHRLAMAALPVCALALMSQTLPESSKEEGKRLSYNTVSVGWMNGDANMSYQDCSGNTFARVANGYSAGAVGFSRTVQDGQLNNHAFGVNAFSGHHQENMTSSPSGIVTSNRTYSYYGVRPYYQFDGRRVGFGVGFNYGLLGTIGSASSSGSPVDNRAQQSSIAPSLSFRYGNLKKFFVEYKYGSAFPTSYPALTHQLALGFGLGENSGGVIRIGTASYLTFYVAPSIPAGNHFVIEPVIGFGGGYGTSSWYGFGGGSRAESGFMGSINLHYKFSKREK